MHLGHNEAREFPNASLTVSRAYRPRASSASLLRNASFLSGSIKRYSRLLTRSVGRGSLRQRNSDLAKEINASMYSSWSCIREVRGFQADEIWEEEKERLEMH